MYILLIKGKEYIDIDDEVLDTKEDVIDRINYYNDDFMKDEKGSLNVSVIKLKTLPEFKSFNKKNITEEDLKEMF